MRKNTESIFKERGTMSDEIKYYFNLSNIWIKPDYAQKLYEWVYEGFRKGEYFKRMYAIHEQYKIFKKEKSLEKSTISIETLRKEKNKNNCSLEEALINVQNRIKERETKKENRLKIESEKRLIKESLINNINNAYEILKKKEKPGYYKVVDITDLSFKVYPSSKIISDKYNLTQQRVSMAAREKKLIKKRYLLARY